MAWASDIGGLRSWRPLCVVTQVWHEVWLTATPVSASRWAVSGVVYGKLFVTSSRGSLVFFLCVVGLCKRDAMDDLF